jgi:hypothetical protein
VTDGHDVTALDGFGDRREKVLEVDAVVHVEGLADLAPYGLRELLSDRAPDLARLVVTASDAWTSGGTVKATASQAASRSSNESTAAASCSWASASAAPGRRVHTAVSDIPRAEVSIGAVNMPAHGPAPTSPTWIVAALPWAWRRAWHAGPYLGGQHLPEATDPGL